MAVVWVAAKFTDEHRASLDWLNDITDDRFRFFGLEVELWRIGQSPAAPKFNIISKPNDWTRAVGNSARRIGEEALSELQETQLRYWAALFNLFDEGGIRRPSRKPQSKSWMPYSIGRSGFHLTTKTNSRDQVIGVELYIKAPEAKTYFHMLKQDRDQIEAELRMPIDWEELPERMASRIIAYKHDEDPTDEASWPRQHRWMAETLDRFDQVFRARVRGLNAEDWVDNEESEVDD